MAPASIPVLVYGVLLWTGPCFIRLWRSQAWLFSPEPGGVERLGPGERDGPSRAGRAVLPGDPGALEGWQEGCWRVCPAQHSLLRPGSFQRPVACSWARPCFLGTFSPLGLEMRREAGSLVTAGGVCREGDASLSLVRSVVGILETVILFLMVRRAVTSFSCFW